MNKTLAELHKIREKMSKEWEKLTPAEWNNYWRKIHVEKLEKEGYEYKLMNSGYKILKKKK